MAIVWLTYAWDDNKDGDIDFIAQELQRSSITVRLDRWNLSAGKRLWEQIANFITNPDLSDAWLLYATQHSLGSEACREEFAYALDRALHTRGQSFPVIALFPASIGRDLIPPAIKARLYISITDPDWQERIKAAVEGRSPLIERALVQPFVVHVHHIHRGDRKYLIEVRPRAGTWSPFVAAIPISEKEAVKPSLRRGPKDIIPTGGYVVMNSSNGPSEDGQWWIERHMDEATPTQSYFIFCNTLPSIFLFGAEQGPTYKVDLTEQIRLLAST